MIFINFLLLIIKFYKEILTPMLCSGHFGARNDFSFPENAS